MTPILLAIAITLFGLVAVAMTLLGLPGTWLMVFAALLAQWIEPGMFSWWIIGGVAGLALVAEVVEFFAAGVGAGRVGGSRRAMWWGVAGALLGSVVGCVALPAPIIGSLVGAIVGAGVFAMLGERSDGVRTWGDSWRVGQAAATGRAISIVIKTAFALLIAATLSVAAFVP